MNVLKRALLPLMFVVGFPVTSPACNQWDVTGTWHIKQGNGYSATVELSGRDGHYNGYAPPAQNGHRQAAATDITLNGNTFSMSLLWGPDNTNATDSIGVYTGQIASDGRISGATYDRAHPKNVTTWSRAEPLKCLDSAAPKPIRRLGKIKPASPPASGADTCITGFVWREARQSDHVCVTPESRSRVAQENSSSQSRVDPNGAYGPASCRPGYVWREAYNGDTVCVTPEVRDRVREENRIATTRVSGQ